jgi:predicted PurR-regulated permease PerM
MINDRSYRNLVLAITTALILTVVFLYAFYQARLLLRPVLAGLLVSYILYPIVKMGRQISIPKGITIMVIFIAMIGGLVFIVSSLVPAVVNEFSAFRQPEEAGEAASRVASSKLKPMADQVGAFLVRVGILHEQPNSTDMIRKVTDVITTQFAEVVTWFTKRGFEGGKFLMVFFFVMVFGLVDGDKFHKGMVQLIPNAYFEPGVFMLRKTVDMWGYYLRGLIVENLIMFVVSFILLLGLKVFTDLSFLMALAIAAIIAFTNVIRIIGPIIGAVVGLILVLSQDVVDFRLVFGIMGVAVIVQLLDSVVILPLVMKDQVNIHPVVCLLGIFLGGVIGGVVGMILAVPFIGGAKVIIQVAMGDMKRFDMHADAVPDYLADSRVSNL